MSGVLEEVAYVRTNGDRNGSIKSFWDHVLLGRDLEQLIAEGRVIVVREAPRSRRYRLAPGPEETEWKWFRDTETGDIYEYCGGWERRGPTFRKLDVDELYRIAPNSKPI